MIHVKVDLAIFGIGICGNSCFEASSLSPGSLARPTGGAAPENTSGVSGVRVNQIAATQRIAGAPHWRETVVRITIRASDRILTKVASSARQHLRMARLSEVRRHTNSQMSAPGHETVVGGRAEHACSARAIQTSTCSAIARASSTSMPRYLTVLSIFVFPSRTWTTLRVSVPIDQGRFGASQLMRSI